MKQSIAKALLEIGAVGFSPESPITFTSGIRSPVYVDNRLLVFHPVEWHLIIAGFKDYIDANRLDFDVIAGVAVGGVPHSSALAYRLKKPSVFIRSQAKEHGKRKLIEGGNVAGQRILLVEDHVTTGGSSLDAVDELRNAGAKVTEVLAIISYRFPDAENAFRDAKLDLHTLTDFSTLLDLARKRDELTDEHVEVIHQWFADPRAWDKEVV